MFSSDVVCNNDAYYEYYVDKCFHQMLCVIMMHIMNIM